jgi:hypothetical protein
MSSSSSSSMRSVSKNGKTYLLRVYQKIKRVIVEDEKNSDG